MSFSFPRSHLAGNTANPDCIMIVGRQREREREEQTAAASPGVETGGSGLDGGLNAEISLSAVLTDWLPSPASPVHCLQTFQTSLPHSLLVGAELRCSSWSPVCCLPFYYVLLRPLLAEEMTENDRKWQIITIPPSQNSQPQPPTRGWSVLESVENIASGLSSTKTVRMKDPGGWKVGDLATGGLGPGHQPLVTPPTTSTQSQSTAVSP